MKNEAINKLGKYLEIYENGVNSFILVNSETAQRFIFNSLAACKQATIKQFYDSIERKNRKALGILE